MRSVPRPLVVALVDGRPPASGCTWGSTAITDITFRHQPSGWAVVPFFDIERLVNRLGRFGREGERCDVCRRG